MTASAVPPVSEIRLSKRIHFDQSETIRELETRLRISEDTNRQLRKQLKKQPRNCESLSPGSCLTSSSSRPRDVSDDTCESQALKEAILSLRQVVKSQERCIAKLRKQIVVGDIQSKKINPPMSSCFTEAISKPVKAESSRCSQDPLSASRRRMRVLTSQSTAPSPEKANIAGEESLKSGKRSRSPRRMRGLVMERQPSNGSMTSLVSRESSPALITSPVPRLKQEITAKSEALRTLDNAMNALRQEIQDLECQLTGGRRGSFVSLGGLWSTNNPRCRIEDADPFNGSYDPNENERFWE
jgi:hypothetical protein